jgi:CHAD domain-containing protein
MAFHLDPHRSLRADIKDLMRRQISRIEDIIDTGAEPRAEVVHDVRKRCKRIRAILRLVRAPLGDVDYRRENSSFRDAARPLAEVRDAKVVVDALDKLAGEQADPDIDHAIGSLRRSLQEEKTLLEDHVLRQEDALADIADALAREKKHLSDWTLPRKHAATLRKGLKKVYRQARAAWRRARLHPSPELLHEWRKEAKYLWHHLELLQPLSRRFKRRSDNVHRLTQLLGDYHDLVLLRLKAASLLSAEEFATTLEKLQRAIDQQREGLRDEALRLGRRLFSKSPRDFVASPSIRERDFRG